ncbi:hypothetical protein C8F01DRAFT_1227157 [Mycena amicta]|nr:hypothetical protein C8F01DRAFT_1227157 [Mycena amicta]
MAALLVEGLQHPHTRLDYFIERAISSKLVDAIEYVSAEGRTAEWDEGFHTWTFDAMSEASRNLPPKPPPQYPPEYRELSHCLVFYPTQILGKGRRLDKVFSFPHHAPDWAKQPAELVRFHRLDSDEVSWSPVASDNLESFHPLAKQTASVEATLEWLEHRHGTAFCLPSSTNVDLLFVIRLADESFVWVVLKALATDEPVRADRLFGVRRRRWTAITLGEGVRLAPQRWELPNPSGHILLPSRDHRPRQDSKGTIDAAVLSLSRLESKVLQTDFFDAIATGVLAGHERKSRWDNGPLHTSSKRLNLKRKSYETDSDSSVAADDDDDEPEEKPKRAPTAKRAKKQPAGRNNGKGKTRKGKGKAVERGFPTTPSLPL